MKVNFGIREKVVISLLALITFVILSGLYLFKQIKKRDDLIAEIILNYQPSINQLSELKNKFEESEKIVRYHALAQAGENEIFIDEFEDLFSKFIPENTKALIDLSTAWTPEDRQTMIHTVRLLMDSLFFSYKSLIQDVYTLKVDGMLTDEVFDEELTNRGIVFLISELDQNLDYLNDKKQSDLLEIYTSVKKQANTINKNTILFSLVLIVFFSVIVILVVSHIRNNLAILQDKLFNLSSGVIPNEIDIPVNTEFSKVFISLNNLFRYLRSLTGLAKKILHKEFDSGVSPLSKDDELGNLLANLQESLKVASLEEEKRKTEDEQRTWVSAGIARINDIIRVSSGKVEELTFELIRELVNYTESGLGAIYLLNNEDKKPSQIKLISAYAGDRRKHLQSSIEIGEGLVGSCVKENQSVYLTDIPKDYVKIKSGLGENDPVSLLISPINYNEIVYGAIEIASFREFPSYRISFVETCCRNIATAISKLNPDS